MQLTQKPVLAVGVVALATLLYELAMIRVLDVLWYPHFAYMVITLALLGFGIAGVISSVRSDTKDIDESYLSKIGIFFTASFPLVFVTLNFITVDFDAFGSFAGLTARLLVIYSAIILPFLFGGLLLSAIFTQYADNFGKLYFVDLLFASMGVFLVPLLISSWGGPGLIFLAGGFAAISVLLLSSGAILRLGAIAIGALMAIGPLIPKDYVEINWHMDKRNFRSLQGGLIEKRWDPISRVDIIKWTDDFNWVAYDGGTQTSYYYNFNHSYDELRAMLPEDKRAPFWDRFVYVGNWVKEGDLDNVLVIGAAGGQETRAALTFGAKHVDAVEMVGTVIQWGKTKYQQDVYTRPEVTVHRDEGRSFLRSSGKTYDLIQIMSNHTTSSIASGSGAVSPNYLLTVDAFKEYFSHLTDDGVLQINHHIYPRMAVTAAAAWNDMGLGDLSQHLVIVEHHKWLTLPTFMISMKPWTEAQITKLRQVFNTEEWRFVHNPLGGSVASVLDDEIFSGELSAVTMENIPYHIHPPTDNKPYFNHLRSNWGELEDDEATKVTPGIRAILNRSLRDGIPMDVVHLFVTGGAAILMALIGLFLPLLISKTGRDPWKGKASFMGYFACLGAGFISVELIAIQLFHKLIGFPIYTYATVIFAFLVSAGLGSLVSDIGKFSEKGRSRWLPFIFIPIYGIALLFVKDLLLNYFLGWSFPMRMVIASIMIFPLGFFMGMPFPMGIARSHGISKGTVGWAWAINGLFTVIGSVFSVVASINIGFTNTLFIAFGIYVLAGLLLQRFSPEIANS